MQSALSGTARQPDGTCTVNRPCGSLNVWGFCAYTGENAAITSTRMARMGIWIPEGQWSPKTPYRLIFHHCERHHLRYDPETLVTFGLRAASRNSQAQHETR